jgi:hypothetical protein
MALTRYTLISTGKGNERAHCASADPAKFNQRKEQSIMKTQSTPQPKATKKLPKTSIRVLNASQQKAVALVPGMSIGGMFSVAALAR